MSQQNVSRVMCSEAAEFEYTPPPFGMLRFVDFTVAGGTWAGCDVWVYSYTIIAGWWCVLLFLIAQRSVADVVVTNVSPFSAPPLLFSGRAIGVTEPAFLSRERRRDV